MVVYKICKKCISRARAPRGCDARASLIDIKSDSTPVPTVDNIQKYVCIQVIANRIPKTESIGRMHGRMVPFLLLLFVQLYKCEMVMIIRSILVDLDLVKYPALVRGSTHYYP